MKVIALGAGGMGRYAARTAVTFDFVDELVVADLDVAAATRCVVTLGAKARAAAVDVTNETALLRLFSGAGAVLNTVGPFFRLGPPVLRAAIKAGCHYLDINDDWESTEAMLAMDEEARARGVTAVIGMGASPGISNLNAPEAIVDPQAFFDRLAPLCDPVKRSAADLLLLSRSWEPKDLRVVIRARVS